MVIEGVNSPSLPFEYRTRSASGDQNMTDNGFSTRQASRSPTSSTPRLPASPIPTSKSGIVASISGGTSLAERKRRLASASGGSAFDHESTLKSTTNFDTKQGLKSPSKGLTSSSSLSLPQSRNYGGAETSAKSPLNTSSRPPPEDERGKRADDNRENTSKPSLRSRLFGLRKTSKEAHESPPLDDDRTSMFSGSSVSVSVAGTDYGKETQQGSSTPGIPSTSSFAASVDGKITQSTSGRSLLSVDRLAAPTASFLLRRGSKGKKVKDGVQSQDADRESQTDSKAFGHKSEDNESSWITSLSSVSPPTMHGFANLDIKSSISPSNSMSASPSNYTMSPSNSRNGLRSPTPDETKKMHRTGSWPPNDRKGSLISTKGEGEYS